MIAEEKNERMSSASLYRLSPTLTLCWCRYIISGKIPILCLHAAQPQRPCGQCRVLRYTLHEADGKPNIHQWTTSRPNRSEVRSNSEP